MEEKWLFLEDLLVRLSFVSHVSIMFHTDVYEVIVHFADGSTFLCGRYEELIDAKKFLTRIEKAIANLCDS